MKESLKNLIIEASQKVGMDCEEAKNLNKALVTDHPVWAWKLEDAIRLYAEADAIMRQLAVLAKEDTTD